jgi:hypothetical protein
MIGHEGSKGLNSVNALPGSAEKFTRSFISERMGNFARKNEKR